MPHPLDGCYAKLDRFNVQFSELQALVGAIEQKPRHLTRKYDPDTGKAGYYLGDVVPPPINISVRIGEMAYNLRSCLDQFAGQLVRLHNTVTPDKTPEFPIFATSTAFADKNAVRKRALFSPDQRAAIEGLQPYKTGRDDLWLIHELNNIDKHRLILVCEFFLGGLGIRKLGIPGNCTLPPLPFGPLESGAKVIECALLPGVDPHAVEMQAYMTSKVFFGVGCGPASNRPVLDLLQPLPAYIRDNVLSEPHLVSGFPTRT